MHLSDAVLLLTASFIIYKQFKLTSVSHTSTESSVFVFCEFHTPAYPFIVRNNQNTVRLSCTGHLARMAEIINVHKGKGKAVPLQAWSGPKGTRKLRFPDFMTTAQDGGKVVSHRHRPPLPPGNTPGTHFC